ncbi:MAG: SDR family oxidoreductase [Acidimicrobiia bacterium]|nr:SDR family oxidoreductase [Acidimicrobiia bacterium]
MELGIAGRRAAVAAASKGLGFAAAAALAAEGVEVAICSRNADEIAAAAQRIGPNAIPMVGDVGTVAGAGAFIAEAGAALGGIDILVANAGGPPPGDFGAIADVDAYARAFELNALSTIAMCQATIPAMRDRQWGRVVAITSIAARQPIANLILSNTARAGLTGFLKTVAREVAADGVTVNSLQPGLHATERIAGLHGDAGGLGATVPAGRIGNPADFGRMVAFLCSESANYVTGTAIPVDGGADAGLQ